MKIKLLLLLVLTFIGCNKKAEKENVKFKTEKVATENVPKEITFSEDCDLDNFLKNQKTPQLAKELFENKAKNDDKALEYFEKLKSLDNVERNFYFKVITNLFKIADGSTSEGLGYLGLEYVENNTSDFLNYFENKKCFSDNDLKIWVGILMLEFSLEYDNEQSENSINRFISDINNNCKNCNTSQKETLKKFSTYLSKEWDNYIQKQE